MNNPLVQKAQYYLNEAHRLNEELKNETEYSELLENILVELIGEEAFYGLFEDLQTSERKKEMSNLQRAAKRKANKDSAEAYREGEMGSAESADAAHDTAAASAAREILLRRKDAKERASKNLYGKGGKIVKEDSVFEDLQTRERASQVQKIIKARTETAKKHDDDAADSAFYDTDDNESRVARAAHSERLLSQAKNRDAREKASKNLYGKGGKIVK